MLFFIFHLHQKKWKKKCSLFFIFIFIKELKNKLLKISRLTLWFFSQVWSAHCSRTSSNQFTMVTWTPRIGSCISMFILLAATFIFVLFLELITMKNVWAEQKQLSWGSLKSLRSLKLLKSFQKSFINSLKIVKVSAEALKDKCEGLYILLSW